MRSCDNPLCENEAIKEVPISYAKVRDQTRHFCAACVQGYSIGVQHGALTSLEGRGISDVQDHPFRSRLR